MSNSRLPLSLLALSRALELSDLIHVYEEVVPPNVASHLLDIFDFAGENRTFKFDTVDWQPDFQIDIINIMQCSLENFSGGAEACKWSNRVVQNLVLPHALAAASAWNLTHSPGGLVLCNSFIRRYLGAERRSHPLHTDTRSLITANVQLSESADFEGGLYVHPQLEIDQIADLSSSAVFPESGLGSLVVHRSDLWHGVKVTSGNRYSWINWFTDTEQTCQSRWGTIATFEGNQVLELTSETYHSIFQNSPLLAVGVFHVGRPQSRRMKRIFNKLAHQSGSTSRFAAVVGPPFPGFLENYSVQNLPSFFILTGTQVVNYFGPRKADALEVWAWLNLGSKLDDDFPIMLLVLWGVYHSIMPVLAWLLRAIGIEPTDAGSGAGPLSEGGTLGSALVICASSFVAALLCFSLCMLKRGDTEMDSKEKMS